MDQRNATNGESTGPVPVANPWEAFADDPLGVMDHLGIRQFAFFGNCIGGPFAMKLMERAPQRVVAAILSQPVGHRPDKPDFVSDAGRDVWAKELLARPPDVSMAIVELYLHNPDAGAADDVVAHPLDVSLDIASLAPNAEITVVPWKEPADLKTRTINRARTVPKRYGTV